MPVNPSYLSEPHSGERAMNREGKSKLAGRLPLFPKRSSSVKGNVDSEMHVTQQQMIQ